MPPTNDVELNEVLQALIGGVRPILADNFIGAYLQGSFAVGDALAHSDVDFLVVVHADVPEAQAPALQAVHVRVYDMASDWARHLEGSYFPEDMLRRQDAVGQPLLYIDNGSRVLERSAHDNTLVVRWVLREYGVTLVGPEPSALLEPVAAGALRSEVWQTMQAWGQSVLADPLSIDNDWAQPYVVLSYCRMLHTLDTGRIGSKPAGAAWARRTLNPGWIGLIERAQAAHAGQPLRGRLKADPEDLANTLEFVRKALAAGQAAAAGWSAQEDNMIKAIVFDFGGVIVRTEGPAGRRQWEARLGLGDHELDRLVFDTDIALRAAVGDVPEAAIWEDLASTLKLTAEQVEALRLDFWAGDKLDQDLVALLASLRPRYQTAILSNAWSTGRETIARRYGLEQAVDTIIISAEERMAKPDPRFYQLAAERLGVHPAEAVFVDDYLPNVEGARAAGWQAIHFRAGMNLRAELETLGVVTQAKYPPA